MTLRTGRFGPYVQLGEAEGEEKPKRSSIPKGVDANAIDLAYALKLLSLPREVGLHPEIRHADHGGPGPLWSLHPHDGTYANLPTVEEVFDVGINRAVALLAEKKAGGGKGRFQRAAPTVLKELGEHPERRRQGTGAVRPLWSLRQAWRRQRHAAAGARSRPRSPWTRPCN